MRPVHAKRPALHVCGGCAFVLLTSCGGGSGHVDSPTAQATSSADAGATHDSTAELEQADARESAALTKQSVASGGLSGQVEASAPPTYAVEDGHTMMKIAIGSESPIECTAYPDGIDPATSIARVLSASGDKVEIQRARPTDAVVAGDGVVLFAEAQYIATTPQGKALGGLKVAAYAGGAVPLFCVHDELGYHATFQRVVTGLANTLTNSKKEAPNETFVDIRLLKVNGHPTGFTRLAMLTRADGAKVTLRTESYVVPMSPTELRPKDTVLVNVTDKSGRVTEVTYIASNPEGGGDQVAVKRVKGSEYRYEGTHAGKAVSGTFKTKDPAGLLGDAESFVRIKKFLAPAAKDTELRLEVYDPSENVTAPEVEVLRAVSRPDRSVTVERGSLKVTSKVDDDGIAQATEVSLGPSLTLLEERAARRGAP